MFGYYLGLGLRHLRRNPVLTALMVVTLAVGVAASMSTLVVLRAISGDPIPAKSDRVFTPLLDVRPDDGSDPDPEPPSQLSYRDAVALQVAKRGVRQTILFRVGPIIDPSGPGRADKRPLLTQGLAVQTDFFPMIGVPFVRGGPWTAADDARGAAVVVLRAGIADRFFGDADPIGQTIRVANRDHTVVGVVRDGWEPLPRFYNLIGGPGAFHGVEDMFLPFGDAVSLQLDPNGQISCYEDAESNGYEGFLKSQCVWLQMWVELGSPADAAAYRDFLAGYVAEQRKLGRFPKKDNQRLHDVMSWLAVNQVVSKDSRLQTYLAFGFLLVCLVNTIGLLLAKFSGRAGEIGVRRALGATRRAVFQQYLTEAGVVGLVGGVAGVLLTLVCLWLIGRQSEELANVAHLDAPMLSATVALAIASSLLAGLLPTWRACQVTPALQLKSQ